MSLEVDIKKQYKGFSLHSAFKQQGGSVAILGASGCGKTITLQSIAGIVAPNEGRIVLNGRVLFDKANKINLKPQQRKVGYLFQNYALFPNMTVEQNIACALGALPKQKRAQTIHGLLARFKLEGLHRRYPSQLSGGQQQRVALARILAYEPELLLLDEPFSALDSHLKEQLQLELLDILKGYPGEVIMVTHSRDEAYKLCPQLMLMDKGRVLALGGTKQIFRRPGCVAAAKLTGCKNITPVQKRGPRRVYAPQWGIHFTTAEDVGEEITHIGVRAHSFVPAQKGDGTPNLFAVHVKKQWEAPFEWNVMFALGEGAKNSEVWWKCAKDIYPTAPVTHLGLPQGEILLLKE